MDSQDLLKRLGFYLSKQNLDKDHLLVSESVDSFVSLDVLYSLPDISASVDSVEKLLQFLKTHDQFIISDDEKGVRLKTEPFDPMEEIECTVRISGFPTSTGEQDICEFLNGFPEVKSFDMIRNLYTFCFTGIVYAILNSEADVKSFIQKELKFADKELAVVSLVSYRTSQFQKYVRMEFIPGLFFHVRGIPRNSNEIDLRRYFRSLLPRDAHIIYDSRAGLCFIRFDRKTDSKVYLKLLNETPFRGQVLTVRACNSRAAASAYRKCLEVMKRKLH